MDDFDPAEPERIRRYGRPDWRGLWPPGWERGLNPAQIEAQRKEFAKWERAFETPLARRLRKEAEERAQIEQERLQAEVERDVLAIKAEFASLRVELARAELRWTAECAERKRQADLAWERFMAAFKRGDFRRKANFNPDQPRDERGRWTTVGEQSDTSDDANTESTESGAQQANVIRICMLGSHSISTDPHGNQSWWADYVCADGFTFRKFGTGSRIRGFWVDPR